MPRLQQNLIVPALLFVLAACQTASLQTAKDHVAANGIVAFKYTANSSRTLLVQDPWRTVIIEDDNGVSQRVSVVNDGLSRSALYVGSVPPGQYRFTEFSGQGQGTIGTPSKDFATFQVSEGRVTYLGTIVEHTNEVQFVLPRSETKHLLLYDPEPAPEGLPVVLDQLYPGLEQVSLDPKTYGGWTKPDDQQAFLYDAVLQASRGLIEPIELPDGSLLFGSLMGQVWIWHPENGWKRSDVGLNRAVEALAATKDGVWLAGGEMGMLRRSNDRGKSWRDVASNLPYGVVKDIHIVGGTPYLTHYRGTAFTLYRGSQDLSRWDSVQSATFAAPGNLYGYTPQRLNTHRHGATLFTTLPNSKLAVFDVKSGTGEIRDLPGNYGTIRVSRDGTLRGTFEKFIGWGTSKSRDNGRTWETAAIGKSAHMPAFRDRSTGVAIQMKTGLTRGYAYLTRTSDGGENWTRGQELPTPFVRWIDYADRLKLILLTDEVSNLYFSRDDGTTWTHAPIEFRAGR